MRIIVTTDTHFNHEKMAELWRVPDYEPRIIRGLKGMVEEGDLFIHLGDIAVTRDIEAHERMFAALPDCKKILTMGNHDRKSRHWYMTHGWDFACDSFIWDNIIFSHYPINPVDVPDKVDINIHGHCHGNEHNKQSDMEYLGFEYDPQFHLELALENTNYQPVLLEKFVKEFTNARASR